MSRNPDSPAKAMRLRLGLTQAEFWGAIGISQSRSSRYENGRKVPDPFMLLITLRYDPKPLKALAALRGTTIKSLIETGK